MSLATLAQARQPGRVSPVAQQGDSQPTAAGEAVGKPAERVRFGPLTIQQQRRTARQTIGQINEVAAAIAAAVEEQDAATREIASNVQKAAQGTQEVSENIESVSQAAGDAGRSAGQLLETASEMSKQSEALRGEVDSFLNQIRAA